jgi:hypothetical protein
MLKAFTDWVLFRHWTPLRGTFSQYEKESTIRMSGIKASQLLFGNYRASPDVT